MLFGSRVTLFLPSLVLLSLAATGFGQQTPTASVTPGNRIYLDVVVTPQTGGPVAGLQQQEFTVLDNKVAKPILSFAPMGGSEAPVEVVLIVDAVNVGYETVAYERDKIERFLAADGGDLVHPVTLGVLTDKGLQLQPSSSRDGKALKAQLDQYEMGLRTIRRSAGFYGAEERMEISLKAMGGLISLEGKKPGRKMILWVSPGWPLLSRENMLLDGKQQGRLFGQIAMLSTALRRSGITIYSIDPIGTNEGLIRSDFYKNFVNGITKPSQVEPGDLGLQVLAVQTGGFVMTTNNDIVAMLQSAMNDSKAYYEISFEAAVGEHPDEYHKVEVQVDKPGMVARTRTGYYAQPVHSEP
ncbi:VWA domain-containing protein [Granulicella aggregans]|nr:VWA domain-containing protein [Granulicella aggregans]